MPAPPNEIGRNEGLNGDTCCLSLYDYFFPFFSSSPKLVETRFWVREFCTFHAQKVLFL